MYQMSPAWQEYYIQLEPDRRAHLLRHLLKEEEDDGANAFRQRLFSLRHMEEGKTEPSVDRYLWACVNFVQVYSTSRFLKRGGRKEVEQFLDRYGYREAAASGERGEAALYWEIRNAAKRYFKTCMGSEYRRSLFGLLSPNGSDQKKQMSLDVWKMTRGLEIRFGMREELKLWTQAVQDEYLLTDPSAASRLEEAARLNEP